MFSLMLNNSCCDMDTSLIECWGSEWSGRGDQEGRREGPRLSSRRLQQSWSAWPGRCSGPEVGPCGHLRQQLCHQWQSCQSGGWDGGAGGPTLQSELQRNTLGNSGGVEGTPTRRIHCQHFEFRRPLGSSGCIVPLFFSCGPCKRSHATTFWTTNRDFVSTPASRQQLMPWQRLHQRNWE